jgi:drug/metabolite transporter superfamily protein YnfA
MRLLPYFIGALFGIPAGNLMWAWLAHASVARALEDSFLQLWAVGATLLLVRWHNRRAA